MKADYESVKLPTIERRAGDQGLTPAFRRRGDATAGAAIIREAGSGERRTYAAADLVRLVTADGRPVNRIGKGRYVIADIDPDRQILLSSDDPLAP